MSRGFESFELDDFRDSQWLSEPSAHRHESSRGRGSSSQTEASVRIKLAKLRETEYQSDQLDWQSRERQDAKPLSLDTQQSDLLSQRERSEIRDRDRSYSLRPSEIHTLTEVGKFRVVAVEDLAHHAYAGDRSRLDSDLRNLDSSTACRTTRHERTQEGVPAGTHSDKGRQTPDSSPRLRARRSSHLLGLCETQGSRP